MHFDISIKLVLFGLFASSFFGAELEGRARGEVVEPERVGVRHEDPGGRLEIFIYFLFYFLRRRAK